MSQSRKAAKSVLIMFVCSLLSKLLGFIREILIASKFGSGIESDTFFVALTATTLFSVFITKALSTTMIPILAEIESAEGSLAKNTRTSNLLNFVLLISSVIIVFSWIFAPTIIKVLASGFKGKQFQLAVKLTRIGLPVIYLASTVGVFRGYLQSEAMFIESAIADLPFNITYIIYLVLLSSIFGIEGLMVASVVAVGTQFIIQLPSLRKLKFRYSLTLDIKDDYIKRIIYLSAPVLISVAINDINKIVDRSLASTLVEGSISALNYANKIEMLIIGVFITSITTVVFPIFSKEANKENNSGLKLAVSHGINIILLITIPATVSIIVLAEKIIVTAFQRGAFDAVATEMTTGALVFYSLGLPGVSLRLLLNKVYYSIQDTKTPMLNGIISVGLNIILNIILIRFMQHKGLALATSIASIISTCYLIYSLKSKIGKLDYKKIFLCFGKSLISSLIMGFFIYVINSFFIPTNSFLRQIIQLLTSISIGALVYFVIMHFMKVEEISWFLALIKSRVNKTNKTKFK